MEPANVTELILRSLLVVPVIPLLMFDMRRKRPQAIRLFFTNELSLARKVLLFGLARPIGVVFWFFILYELVPLRQPMLGWSWFFGPSGKVYLVPVFALAFIGSVFPMASMARRLGWIDDDQRAEDRATGGWTLMITAAVVTSLGAAAYLPFAVDVWVEFGQERIYVSQFSELGDLDSITVADVSHVQAWGRGDRISHWTIQNVVGKSISVPNLHHMQGWVVSEYFSDEPGITPDTRVR